MALVDDHHLFREGLRLVLTATGIDVVGECPTAEGVFELVGGNARTSSCSTFPSPSRWHDAPARTSLAYASVHIVVVTMHRDPETVRQALRAGAAGYVVKGAHSADLYEAIAAVMRGERYLHSSVTRIVVDDSVRWFYSDAVLTAREREIVSLLAAGSGPSDVGRRLGISPHTVRRHIANLSSKLGIRGTAALVQYAIREGLVRERPS